jgi:hypothetical protein
VNRRARTHLLFFSSSLRSSDHRKNKKHSRARRARRGWRWREKRIKKVEEGERGTSSWGEGRGNARGRWEGGRGSGEWVFSLLEILRWYRSSHARSGLGMWTARERQRLNRRGADGRPLAVLRRNITTHTRRRKFQKRLVLVDKKTGPHVKKN